MRRQILSLKVSVFLVWIIVINCSWAMGKPISDEQRLKARAKSYWELKIKEDYKKTYDYEISTIKKQYPVDKYIRLFGSYIRYEKAEIKNIEFLDKKNAKVHLILHLTMPIVSGKKKHRMPFVDNWVKENGKWMHYLKPLGKGGEERGKKADEEIGLKK